MNRVFVSVIIFIFSFSALHAQEYKNAVGLRGGLPYGITCKHFTGSKTALEGIIATRWDGFSLTGLYEIHNPTRDYPNLRWYYGGGAQGGLWNGSNPYVSSLTTTFSLGVTGVLGMEYTFDDIPVNLSIDWLPMINIIQNVYFDPVQIGIAIRYVF